MIPLCFADINTLEGEVCGQLRDGQSNHSRSIININVDRTLLLMQLLTSTDQKLGSSTTFMSFGSHYVRRIKHTKPTKRRDASRADFVFNFYVEMPRLERIRPQGNILVSPYALQRRHSVIQDLPITGVFQLIGSPHVPPFIVRNYVLIGYLAALQD